MGSAAAAAAHRASQYRCEWRTPQSQKSSPPPPPSSSSAGMECQETKLIALNRRWSWVTGVSAINSMASVEIYIYIYIYILIFWQTYLQRRKKERKKSPALPVGLFPFLLPSLLPSSKDERAEFSSVMG